MSESEHEKPESAPVVAPQQSKNMWEYADLGFDTTKKLWFIQFYDESGKNLGLYPAKDIVISRGSAAQYQWKDSQGRNFWHVRERFFAREVEGFTVNPLGSIIISFRRRGSEPANVPSEYSYLTYAFHLSNKDEVGKAPMGFVEFFDSKGSLLSRIDNKWIILENTSRKTTGEYPKIRIRIDKKDLRGITMTESAIILQGSEE